MSGGPAHGAALRLGRGDLLAVDLDDTLYHEADFVRSGVAAAAAALRARGLPCPAALLGRLFVARQPLFDGLCAAWPAARPHRAALLRAYREHWPGGLQPRRGARAMLRRARCRGARIVLITDGRSGSQRRKLAALGLAAAFDLVLISEETGADKLRPDNFVRAMGRLPGRRCAYVGDNPAKDFTHPTALGWQCRWLQDDGRHVHRRPPPPPPGVRPVRRLGALL